MSKVVKNSSHGERGGHGGLVPELRFPEFRNSDPWKLKPLGDGFTRITTKNSENNKNALTISAQQGLVSQLDYFNKQVAAKDLSGYYLLNKGDFAYNKSYSQGYPMGAIKPLSLYDKGVVSTLYICFRAKDGFNNVFYEHFFETDQINQEIGKIAQEGGRAHGLLNVSVTEFFNDLNILVPTPKEQQRIADCLSSMDELISAHSQKLEALKTHKKGLMQNLFPAEGEKVPQLRFPEFRGSGDWEEKVFENIYKFQPTNSLSREKLNYRTGSVKNIHYGDIHKQFSILFDAEKEVVPYISDSEYVGKIKSTSYCRETDIIFADASEDLNDIGKCIEIVNLRNQKIVSGLHTLLARQQRNDFIKGFGGYFFKSPIMRSQIQKESQGTKVLGISGKRILAMKIFVPKQPEQQRIADCLSSLDELITAQSQKIESLKAHKNGLMQRLFPVMDEVGA